MTLIRKGSIKEHYFATFWKHKRLVGVFVRRDIRIHYAQTRLGLILAFVQAIAAALLFQLFFGMLLHAKVSELPYIVYAFPGIMAWYLFSHIISYSGTALIQSQDLVKKVYFPKLILPVYKSMVGLVEFVIWLLVYMGILLYYGITPSPAMLLLIPAVLLILINGLSLGIWLCALTTRMRDAIHLIPFLIGFGVFVTPVFYSSSMIPASFALINKLNPMTGAIEFLRWCLLGGMMDWSMLWGMGISILLLITGLYYFRAVDAKASDTL
jgi:lipopolysaccharide transport system permease protein